MTCHSLGVSGPGLSAGSCAQLRTQIFEAACAMLINHSFARGDSFARVQNKALPDWAAEFDCKSWAQFLLKWILGNAIVFSL